MKKLIIPTMVLAMLASEAKGQTLYQAVYDKAKSTVDNPAATEAEKQASLFKIKALDYLKQQGNIDGQKRDSYFFDSQAVNLTSFIEDFLTNTQTAAKASKAKEQEMIRCYTNAASKNPLFPIEIENEKALPTESLIPFSVNTDWEKAYDNASTLSRTIIKKK